MTISKSIVKELAGLKAQALQAQCPTQKRLGLVMQAVQGVRRQIVLSLGNKLRKNLSPEGHFWKERRHKREHFCWISTCKEFKDDESKELGRWHLWWLILCRLGGCFWRLTFKSVNCVTKADSLQWCGWASPNQLKTWLEQKDEPPPKGGIQQTFILELHISSPGHQPSN